MQALTADFDAFFDQANERAGGVDGGRRSTAAANWRDRRGDGAGGDRGRRPAAGPPG